MNQAETLKNMPDAALGTAFYPASPRVICITSGKGGVGKTNVAVNLAYGLRKKGKRVLLLDADLNLANIDVLLGLTPRYNLHNVFLGEKTLRDILIEGPAGMHILPASSGIMEMADLSESQKLSFMTEIEVFDPQRQAFEETETGAVHQHDGNEVRPGQMLENRGHLVACEYDWENLRSLRSHYTVEPVELDAEHVLVQEQEGAERLVLRGGSDVLFDGKVGKESFDLFLAHFARVAEPVESQITVDPVGIGFFGPTAVVSFSDLVTELAKQCGFGRMLRGIRFGETGCATPGL